MQLNHLRVSLFSLLDLLIRHERFFFPKFLDGNLSKGFHSIGHFANSFDTKIGSIMTGIKLDILEMFDERLRRKKEDEKFFGAAFKYRVYHFLFFRVPHENDIPHAKRWILGLSQQFQPLQESQE